MSIKKIQTRDGIKLRNTKTNKLAGSVGKGKKPPEAQSPIKRHRWKIPLSESHPDALSEIYNWDPSRVTAGSKKLKELKCKTCGHIRLCSPQRMVTGNGSGTRFCKECGYIRANSLSLLEEFPDIVAEAYGWNPALVSSHNGKEKSWKCQICAHVWETQVANRTDKKRTGCPKCGVEKAIRIKQIKSGLNSFHSTFPTKSKEALGWNPELLAMTSKKMKKWKCPICKVVFESTPNMRATSDLYGQCPHSDLPQYTHKGKKRVYIKVGNQNIVPCLLEDSIFINYSDLAQECSLPEKLLKQISSGASLVIKWTCQTCSWQWEAPVNTRTHKGQGCPSCAKTGYDSSKPGTLYFLRGIRGDRHILQYGITNNIKDRISYHKRNGFFATKDSEFATFSDGEITAKIEREIKNSLKTKSVPSVKEDISSQDKYPGYTESVYASNLPGINSLKELLSFLNIEIEVEPEWNKWQS